MKETTKGKIKSINISSIVKNSTRIRIFAVSHLFLGASLIIISFLVKSIQKSGYSLDDFFNIITFLLLLTGILLCILAYGLFKENRISALTSFILFGISLPIVIIRYLLLQWIESKDQFILFLSIIFFLLSLGWMYLAFMPVLTTFKHHSNTFIQENN